MFALLVAFVVVPLVEIYVMIKVGQQIGVLYTIALLLGLSFFGAWLATRQGFAVYRRFRRTLNAGSVPTNELIDGVMIFAGGVLLLVPGFVTDAFGLLLLLPPVRLVVRKFVKRRYYLQLIDRYGTRRVERGGSDDVIDI